MSDIAIEWNNELGHGDWLLASGDLALEDGLQSAVYLSVFTDRVANPDDVIPDGTADPRGWWADAGQGKPIGSRLWLLSRAKQTNQTLLRAKDYILEAVAWLIDDGVVGQFDITVEWRAPSQMGIRLVAIRPDGQQSTMQWLWAGTLNAV